MPVSGKGFADIDPFPLKTWEQYYYRRFAGYGLKPLKIFGEYEWNDDELNLRRRWIVFLSADHGLLQYQCEAGYVSVISRNLILEDIMIVLSTRSDRFLDNGSSVSEAERRSTTIKLETPFDADCFDMPNFGARTSNESLPSFLYRERLDNGGVACGQKGCGSRPLSVLPVVQRSAPHDVALHDCRATHRSWNICTKTSANMLFAEGSGAVSYKKLAHDRIPVELLVRCAKLFSEQYGVWGPLGPRPGHPVTMSASALRKNLLDADGTFLVVAIDEDCDAVAGHAFARRFAVPELLGRSALWITQLVVNSSYRNRGIGAHLISTALDPRDVCAGLATSHPYAVRALEKATRKECVVDFVRIWGQTVLDASGVPYLHGRVVSLGLGSTAGCRIDTQFFVDHTEVNGILETLDERWKLGRIADGEEFVALVDLR